MNEDDKDLQVAEHDLLEVKNEDNVPLVDEKFEDSQDSKCSDVPLNESNDDSEVLNDMNEDIDQTIATGGFIFMNCFLKILMIIYFLYTLGAIAFIVIVLITNRATEDSCKHFVFWVYFELGILIIAAVTKFLSVQNKFNNECFKRILIYNQNTVHIIWCIWTIIGSIWYLSGSCETRDSIFYLSLCIVIINIILLSGIILIVCCLMATFAIFYFAHYGSVVQTITGATDKMIEQLEIRTYTSTMLEKEDTLCAICLNNYVENDQIRFLNCSPKQHHFHKDCVDPWLKMNKTCPYCKQSIDKSSTNPNESV